MENNTIETIETVVEATEELKKASKKGTVALAVTAGVIGIGIAFYGIKKVAGHFKKKDNLIEAADIEEIDDDEFVDEDIANE